MIKFVRFVKDILVVSPITVIFAPFSYVSNMLVHIYLLNKWVRKNKDRFVLKNTYSASRNYSLRFTLYGFVVEHFNLQNRPITYLEFGVAAGSSFKWWLANNSSHESRFFGFDTFEGLPEDWGGFFKKGDMSSDIPQTDDVRARFIKGLFQDTLNKFINEQTERLNSDTLKVIHLDADIYSATAFTLSQLYPFLNKGDIILFDEFNVPLHEFKAFHEFTNNFYVQLRPIAAVNNYYQTAFVVE